MATNLTNESISASYGSVLHIANDNSGVDETKRIIYDGVGNKTSLHLSPSSANITGVLSAQGLFIGDDRNLTPDSSGDGHIRIDGNGYTGFLSLDANAMWVGHNSGAKDVYLSTDETARMTIKGDGKVGLGTTAPNKNLTVMGSICAAVAAGGNVVTFHSTSGSGAAASGTHNELVIDSGETNIGINILGSTSSDQRILFGDTGHAGRGQLIYTHGDDQMGFSTAGTRRATIDSSGKVGIGTTAPNKNLTVMGSICATDELNVRATDGVYWYTPGHVFGYRIRANASDVNDYGLMFEKADGTDLMIIMPDGDVGIGLASPGEKLTVVGNISASGNLYTGRYIYHGHDTDTFISFTDDTMAFYAGNEALLTLSEGSTDAVTIGDGGDVDFLVKTAGAYENSLYIKGDTGNVGIGVNPSYPFHVDYNKTSDTNDYINRFTCDDTTADDHTYMMYYDFNLSYPPSNYTGDKTKAGVYIDVDSSLAPDTMGTYGERLYGQSTNVYTTHDPEYLRGHLVTVYSTLSAGAIHESVAGYNYNYQIGNGTVTSGYANINTMLCVSGTNANIYSSYNKTSVGNPSASYGGATVGSARGVYGEVETNHWSSALTNAYAFQGIIDCNYSVRPTNSYLFYGDVQGDGGSSLNYGIYVNGSTKNFLDGETTFGNWGTATEGGQINFEPGTSYSEIYSIDSMHNQLRIHSGGTVRTQLSGSNFGIGQHTPLYMLHISSGDPVSSGNNRMHNVIEGNVAGSISIQSINWNTHSNSGAGGVATGDAVLGVKALTGAAGIYFASFSSLTGAGDHSAGANAAVSTRWVVGQLSNSGPNHNVGTGNPYTLGRCFHFLQQVTTDSGASYTNQSNSIKLGDDGGIYPGSNDANDLGHTSNEWRDIYAGNGTIQSSDGNLKENIADSNLGLTFINSLKPRTYKWKDYTVEETNDVFDGETNKLIDTVTSTRTKTHSRTHYGLIAQEVKTSLTAAGVDTKDFAGYIDGNITNAADGSGKLGLRYTEFISPLIKAIQEQQTIIESLSTKLDALDSTIDSAPWEG
jgi:hypothetical protein